MTTTTQTTPTTNSPSPTVKLTLASLHLITGGLYVAGIAGLRRTNTGVAQ